MNKMGVVYLFVNINPFLPLSTRYCAFVISYQEVASHSQIEVLLYYYIIWAELSCDTYLDGITVITCIHPIDLHCIYT